jgi:hypothetical protein
MRPKMFLGIVCLFSATTFAACQPSQSLDAASSVDVGSGGSHEPGQLQLDVPESAPPVAAKAVQPKKSTAKNMKSGAPAPSKPVEDRPSNAPEDAMPAMASTPLVESHPVSAARDQDGESIATTIVGCLVEDDGMFRLKDTDGQHAPKSRSWKSGFIKKGTAKIDLVDAGSRLELDSHVGHRISVSGTLTDREMHARSVRTMPERCD